MHAFKGEAVITHSGVLCNASLDTDIHNYAIVSHSHLWIGSWLYDVKQHSKSIGVIALAMKPV